MAITAAAATATAVAAAAAEAAEEAAEAAEAAATKLASTSTFSTTLPQSPLPSAKQLPQSNTRKTMEIIIGNRWDQHYYSIGIFIIICCNKYIIH